MEKFTVIEGGKGENPGATHELPKGFQPANHQPRTPGGIPCIGPDGIPGELVEVTPGKCPPEIALLLLMAILGQGHNH